MICFLRNIECRIAAFLMLLLPIYAWCHTATITLRATVPIKLEFKKDFLIKQSKKVNLYDVKTHKYNNETVVTISAKC